jgi:integrase
MTQPVPIPVRQRKKRVLIPSRLRQKLERRKRMLDEAVKEALYNNSDAVKITHTDTVNTIKPIKELAAEYLAASPELCAKTIELRRDAIDRLARFLGPRPLSRELLEEFNQQLHASEYAATTKAITGSIISSFIGWLYESDRIPKDWRKGIKWPSMPRQVPRKIYTEEEYKKLLETAGDGALGFVIRVAWHLGTAITDACNLEWRHVDMERGLIAKPRQKTSVEFMNVFDFGTDLHRALERQRAETIHVFGSIRPGFPVCKEAYQNKASVLVRFKQLCLKAGVEYRSFHSFRATYLTRVANSTAPLNVQLKLAGLANLNQLIAYVKTTPEDLRRNRV